MAGMLQRNNRIAYSRIPLLFLFILLQQIIVFGQEPKQIFQNNFDDLTAARRGSGIQGNALNLTASATDRRPLVFQLDPAAWKDSFTLIGWVNAQPDYEKYQIFDLQLQYADSTQVHWTIEKQQNNSWSWNLKAGQIAFDYTPGYKRQPIAQAWHMLAMSYDAAKEEVQLYYDHQQVAIYSLEGIRSNAKIAGIKLQIGGKTQVDLGEWESFNGLVDELSLYPTFLRKETIEKVYYQTKGTNPDRLNIEEPTSLKVMSYNIWHGGNESGKIVGPERIADLIRASGADLIAMQETYGSGPKIADELGYYFYLRSSNISVMSRYPIEETLPAYKPFHHGNVRIKIGKQGLVFSSIWLNYPLDYWGEIDQGRTMDPKEWIQKQAGNTASMRGIIAKLSPYLTQTDDTPVIIAGDFNSGSHLDWTAALKSENAGYVMPFPTSIFLDSLGFQDTYRIVHPDPKQERGLTWTPINPNTHQDRIDFIYLKGKRLQVLDAQVISSHPVRYPSDHAAVLTLFSIKPNH